MIHSLASFHEALSSRRIIYWHGVWRFIKTVTVWVIGYFTAEYVSSFMDYSLLDWILEVKVSLMQLSHQLDNFVPLIKSYVLLFYNSPP